MNPRLLIADDEEAILFAMHEYFVALGYDVNCVRSQEEARALLDARHYAVVIADLRLDAGGAAEGLELVGHVRSRWPETHTIILTAYGSPEIEAQARSIGVEVFLNKPVQLDHVAGIVRRLAGPSTGGGAPSSD